MGRKKCIFKGSAVALITPFSRGRIDYGALGELIDFQIANGTDGIVLLGTTGEASCVSERERMEMIPFAKQKIRGRVPLVVGTGTNSTEVSVRYTKMAEALGADGCLVVTPYYNKASENGLILHYKEIASSVRMPIIMYNVPSRTGLNIPMGAYEALSKIDTIVGVKEASGNLTYASELIAKYGNDFYIYSGNDELTLPYLSLGGSGVISVTANLLPSYMHQLCAEFTQGSVDKSKEIQLFLSPLIKELFSEVNPIPVKTALYLMDMCKNEFRLPMCQSARKKQLEEILRKYNLC